MEEDIYSCLIIYLIYSKKNNEISASWMCEYASVLQYNYFIHVFVWISTFHNARTSLFHIKTIETSYLEYTCGTSRGYPEHLCASTNQAAIKNQI
jgi:hypothetical protein